MLYEDDLDSLIFSMGQFLHRIGLLDGLSEDDVERVVGEAFLGNGDFLVDSESITFKEFRDWIRTHRDTNIILSAIRLLPRLRAVRRCLWLRLNALEKLAPDIADITRELRESYAIVFKGIEDENDAITTITALSKDSTKCSNSYLSALDSLLVIQDTMTNVISRSDPSWSDEKYDKPLSTLRRLVREAKLSIVEDQKEEISSSVLLQRNPVEVTCGPLVGLVTDSSARVRRFNINLFNTCIDTHK